jgi:hypothetical protein
MTMTNRRFILAVAASGLLSTHLAAAAVNVELNNTAGTPGQTVELAAVLTANGQESVAGIENDLRFDPGAPIATGADGRPDCSPNPAIRKDATAFSFRPIGCDPQAGQCTGVHALVVAVDNVDSIASGAVLYRCRVAISARAQRGRYSIAVTNALYTPPAGGDSRAQGTDGAVTALGSGAPPSAGNGGAGCQIGAGGSSASLWLGFALVVCWRWCRSRAAR